MSSENKEMDGFMTDGNGYCNERYLEVILLLDSSQEKENSIVFFYKFSFFIKRSERVNKLYFFL